MSPRIVIHATTVQIDGRGLALIGPSGSGKSGLALQLMAMGAVLVADDRTIVVRHGNRLIAQAPETLIGQIEARYIGILDVPYAEKTPLVAAVDLSQQATARLPEPQNYPLLGMTLPCLHRVDQSHFAPSLLFYVKGIPHDVHEPPN